MVATTRFDNEFISLDRTFHELQFETDAGDNADLTRFFGRGDTLRWSDLLREYRIVLLSEAGSGKTEEIRHAARGLRRDGKRAFFIRIEHITSSFEDAFEEGTFEEFADWVASGDEGWVLLDSVDEARLRDPKDFERAIRKLGGRLKDSLQQTHIVVTGRTTAWRPMTDLLLCRTELPYRPADNSAIEKSSTDKVRRRLTRAGTSTSTPAAPFRIVALDDLHGPQIEAFLSGKQVNDSAGFRDAVARKDAWSLTTRPQDLTELVEFWKEHGRIGSRLELMMSSIARRLSERDQDRSDARPIALDRLRLGARLVAAAATLSRESAIRVPDGAENAKGLAIREVLTDWNDTDCATLLSRPIFDEGLYGTVRFHHRSVREYLTAEWLIGLINDEGSRARIESLFFKSQYGIEVIVPTMRPVLPWLAILDDRILARLCRLAPEVIFEGGDPSRLPLVTRRAILRQTCERLLHPAHGSSLIDYAGVQRFANPDLTDEIKTLLSQYEGDDDITWFLLRMVWQGEISGAASDVKRFALSSRAKYTRTAAFRALAAIGSIEDQEQVRQTFLSEPGDVDRDWLAELVVGLPRSHDAVRWLLAALERAPERKRFESDQLPGAVSNWIADLPLALVSKLVEGLCLLLNEPPVVEKGDCEISVRHSWLAQHAAEAVLRLVEARDSRALDIPALSILRTISSARSYGEHEFGEIPPQISEQVGGWLALSHALFWHSVAATRAALDAKSGERLTDYWRVSLHGRHWSFGADAFDLICSDIGSKSLLDDRLIALTLAFRLYRQFGRPRAWRERLKQLVGEEGELKAELRGLLRPPAQGRERWRQQETLWKRRAEREAARLAANGRMWKEHLESKIEAIRSPEEPGVITDAQYYLHRRMDEGADRSGKWSAANWRALVPEFGEPVARAFRDGAIQFWRTHRPPLRSDGLEANTTPFPSIFGLTGLAIEAREEPTWPQGLSDEEAELAARFALNELNGFPSWLRSLYAVWPGAVVEVVMGEIDHELATESEGQYVLYDVSWDGSWMWDRLAPLVVQRLHKRVSSIGNLRYMLTIVHGSSLDDATVAELAAQNSKKATDLSAASLWFASWVGVDPAVAIPALAARLAEITENDDRTEFAMRFIRDLLGSRAGSRGVRRGPLPVEHLKALYLLMHAHVRERDDLDRSGGGVYSPGLRDEAQEARDALFSFIRETPGKEAFLALMEISRAHPAESSRPWMAVHAKAKAALDADGLPWSAAQVREFHDNQERTPSHHRDLWHLAIDRLMDLKNDLEEGDSSVASILQPVGQETQIRKYIGNWCRERSAGRYVVPQEEELADAKKPDLRFHGIGFDAPVPIELKLVDKWSGPHLFERLEIQLCGDYLRDRRSSRGIFLLVFQGTKPSWDLPNGRRAETFNELVEALQAHWSNLASHFPGIEDIGVIGIDLTKRGIDAKTASLKPRTKGKDGTKVVAGPSDSRLPVPDARQDQK